MRSGHRRISVRLTEAIPELGAEEGAVVSFDPARPDLGVLVTYQLPLTSLPLLAARLPQFRGHPPRPSPPRPPRNRHLRVLDG